MSFLRDIRRRADEVALEADKALRVRQKQSEIGQAQKLIDRKINDLGWITYRLFKQGNTLAESQMPFCTEIGSLESTIASLEEEIEQIRKEELEPLPSQIASKSCTNCGRSIPVDAAFCQHCGVQVPAPLLTIQCTNCGTSLPADARFCANCGQTVVASSEPVESKAEDAVRACPECGAEMAGDASFCEMCGAVLGNLPATSEVVQDTRDEADAQRVSEPDGEQPDRDVALTKTTIQAQVVADDEPVYCAVCAAEIPADAPFCAVCGAATD